MDATADDAIAIGNDVVPDSRPAFGPGVCVLKRQKQHKRCRQEPRS